MNKLLLLLAWLTASQPGALAAPAGTALPEAEFKALPRTTGAIHSQSEKETTACRDEAAVELAAALSLPDFQPGSKTGILHRLGRLYMVLIVSSIGGMMLGKTFELFGGRRLERRPAADVIPIADLKPECSTAIPGTSFAPVPISSRSAAGSPSGARWPSAARPCSVCGRIVHCIRIAHFACANPHTLPIDSGTQSLRA